MKCPLTWPTFRGDASFKEGNEPRNFSLLKSAKIVTGHHKIRVTGGWEAYGNKTFGYHSPQQGATKRRKSCNWRNVRNAIIPNEGTLIPIIPNRIPRRRTSNNKTKANCCTWSCGSKVYSAGFFITVSPESIELASKVAMILLMEGILYQLM